MAIKRKVSRSKYVMAGVLTFMIFSLGLTLGIIMDSFRISWAEQEVKQHELGLAGLQFQYLYISSLEDSKDSCNVMNIALEKTIAQLGESLDKFLEYEKRSNLKKGEYEILRQQYLLDNLRYWLFAEKSKKLCELDKVTVLYFHSVDTCDICPEQGVVLTYFKKIFDERLLVFPIDTDLEKEEPMISILKTRYNVTKYPSLIIDDTLYEGVVEKKELGRLICNSFKNEQPECK